MLVNFNKQNIKPKKSVISFDTFIKKGGGGCQTIIDWSGGVCELSTGRWSKTKSFLIFLH